MRGDDDAGSPPQSEEAPLTAALDVELSSPATCSLASMLTEGTQAKFAPLVPIAPASGVSRG
jgi:hypothetical protein